MKKGTSQGRVEKQSNPARGARALTPNRQSVSVSNNYADSSDSALNPGTAPQHRYYIPSGKSLGTQGRAKIIILVEFEVHYVYRIAGLSKSAVIIKAKSRDRRKRGIPALIYTKFGTIYTILGIASGLTGRGPWPACWDHCSQLMPPP
jgi:hypothetical protein